MINKELIKEIYTTNETLTNMQINNKKVYTITKEFSPIPSNASSEINPNINELEQLYLDYNLSYYTWGGNRKYALNDSINSKLSTWISNENKVTITSQRSDGNAWKLHAVFLYTKITD